MLAELLSVLQLAYRNAWRTFPRRWPVMVLLVLTVALLFVGNSLFESTTDGLRRTYTDSLTGDWTISSVSRESFTLFGSDLPLIGEYYVLPTLPQAEETLVRLRSTKGIKGVVPQVTAAGRLSLDGWSTPVPIFGVSFSEYFSFFPGLEIVSGSLLSQGVGEVFLNDTLYSKVAASLGYTPPIGATFTLSVFNDNSFTIRPVVLRGVFHYPTKDDLLSRVILVDADTARALNGYIYGGSLGTAASTGISNAELDSLFSGVADVTADRGTGLNETEVSKKLSDTAARDSETRVLSGSWNFLLVRGDRPPAETGTQVRDWRASAGGSAQIVWLVQLVFNIGLGFVMAGAAFTVINSLSLAVTERTREIGTMRALGSTRSRVAGIIGAEVLLVVSGSGVLGILLGFGLLEYLHQVGIPLENTYLQSLFGTTRLRPLGSFSGVVSHLLFVFFLGLASLMRPVSLALRISPIRAISRGS